MIFTENKFALLVVRRYGAILYTVLQSYAVIFLMALLSVYTPIGMHLYLLNVMTCISSWKSSYLFSLARCNSDHTLWPCGPSCISGDICSLSSFDKQSTANTKDVTEFAAKKVQSFSCALTRTLPQPWQWCLRRVRLKSAVQFMHIITCETGTSVGAFSPRSSLRPSLDWTDTHTCLHSQKHKGMKVFYRHNVGLGHFHLSWAAVESRASSVFSHSSV